MKYYTAVYFYALALLVRLLAVLTKSKLLNMANYDGNYAVNYYSYFIWASALAVLTAIVYTLMIRFNKPISNKTGLYHFGFIVIGLFFSLAVYRIYAIISSSGADTTALATDAVSAFFMLVGPLCLLVGFIIFIYGIIKAFQKSALINKINNLQ